MIYRINVTRNALAYLKKMDYTEAFEKVLTK